jgi:hypothetical protein
MEAVLIIPKCDICLEKKSILPLKCNHCEFCSHEECLVTWFSSCNNYLCPHCKKERSYDIDYSKVVFSKEDEDIPSIIAMMSHLDIETIIEILSDTLNIDIFNNQSRRDHIENRFRELGHNFEPVQEPVQEIINPVFSQILLEIIVSELLQEGQMFAPETFIRDFNILPIQIRAKWSYLPVTMEIDGNQEVIAYKIIKTRDELEHQDIFEDIEDIEDN